MPIEPGNINRHLDRVIAAVTVPRIRSHDLLPSCASMLYARACRWRTSRTSSATPSPQVTKMIYIDIADQVPRAAVERLGYLFDWGLEP